MKYGFIGEHKELILKKELRILDIGCGNDLEDRYNFLQDGVKYENITCIYLSTSENLNKTFDIIPDTINKFKNKINLIDTNFLNFNTKFVFDMVFAEQVLHYPSFYNEYLKKFTPRLCKKLNSVTHENSQIHVYDSQNIDLKIWCKLFSELKSTNINFATKQNNNINFLNFKNGILQ